MVISDTSTLIHLSSIERLGLLQDFYGQVVLPPAVWREVVEQGHARAGASEVSKAHQDGWIQILAPTNEPFLRLLQHDLGTGEAEAIALAVEQHADLILIDESDGRRMAAVYEPHKTGIIGILIRGRLENKIPVLKPELDNLRALGGFWIEDKLYQQALETVGELS